MFGLTISERDKEKKSKSTHTYTPTQDNEKSMLTCVHNLDQSLCHLDMSLKQSWISIIVYNFSTCFYADGDHEGLLTYGTCMYTVAEKESDVT